MGTRRLTASKLVRILSVTALFLGLFVIPSLAANPVVSGSNFEGTDGNTNPGVGTLDWNTASIQGDVTVKPDQPTGASDDSFGQGTKESTAVPTVVDGSIPPNKSDLLEFGAFKEENSSGKFLHLFWTRVQDPSGTTNMDFELNQKSCILGGNVTGCSSNGVTPTRTAGDLLITYDLSNGGTVATISLRRWTAGGTWTEAQPLTSTVASGGINNDGSVSLTKTGNDYSTRTFGEASINLNQIFTSQTCQTFGGAYLKSRSSDSFTAALKDFIAPTAINLTNCGRLVVHKKASSASGSFLAGAGFTVSPANEQGVSSMSEVATGVFCLDNLTLGATYTVTESTVPDGYKGGAPQNLTVSSATGCSGVSQTSPSSPDATFVNNRLQGYIDIVKKDDTAPTKLPLAGAVFTAYADAAPTTGQTAPGTEDTTSLGTCTTDADGLCSIGPVNTGPYWVVETTTPSGYATAPAQRVVVSGDNQRFELTFVDPRLFKVITIVCKQADNKLYQSSVTFDGDTKSSLPKNSTLPDGVTEAKLCGLGGAAFSGKQASATAKTGSVTISPTPAP